MTESVRTVTIPQREAFISWVKRNYDPETIIGYRDAFGKVPGVTIREFGIISGALSPQQIETLQSHHIIFGLGEDSRRPFAS